MEYVLIYYLVWAVSGLVGYNLLAYKDILDKLTEVEQAKIFKTKDGIEFNLTLKPTKVEYLKGMAFALFLGPFAIMWFIVSGE